MQVSGAVTAAARRTPLAPGAPLRWALTALVPLAVFASLVERGTGLPLKVVEGIIAIGFVVAVARRPGPALGVLVVFLPLQQVLLAALLRFGAPASVVRGLGGVKEGIVIGVAIAGVGAFRRGRRRLDALDALVLAYLLLLVAYLLAPFVLRGVLAAVPFHVRLLALRDDGLFALAFLGARHADVSPRARRAVVRCVAVAALVVAASALYEYVDERGWNRFLVTTLQVPRYKSLVLGVATDPTDALTHGMIGSQEIVRVSGVLLSPLTIGFTLLLPLAVGLQRVTRRRPTAFFAATAVLSMAAIVVTLTRSAILAALVTVAVIVRFGFRRLTPGRIRLLFFVLAAAAIVSPLAGSSTPVQRVAATFSGSDQSTSEHRSSLQIGLDAIRGAPLGLGLGTAPAIGDRFRVNGRITSENAYLQVGNEVGVETMVVFVAALLVLLRRLGSASRERGPDGDLASAVLAAGVGLTVGGLFLHIWADFPTAVVFWAVAGIVLGAGRRPDIEQTADRGSRPDEIPAAT